MSRDKWMKKERKTNRVRKKDGYTELPNEATAVDFLQPLRKMRKRSCNGLAINNVLVSGP